MLLTSRNRSDVTSTTWHRKAETDLPRSLERPPVLVDDDTSHLGSVTPYAMRSQGGINLSHVVRLFVHRISDMSRHVNRVGICVHDVPALGELRPPAPDRRNEQAVARVKLQRHTSPVVRVDMRDSMATQPCGRSSQASRQAARPV